MILKSFKSVIITLLLGSVVYLTSCEKQKITFKKDSTPANVILPPECEACHNNSYPVHSTNAHSKHTTGLYTFACTTCHFERGDGTSYHMDGSKDINFDTLGLATRKGADNNTPSYDPITKTCSNIYCHSNGVTADRGHDSTYTWSAIIDAPNGTLVYTTTPSWETGKITSCNFCHNGLGNMVSPYQVSRPNTMVTGNYPASGKHQLSLHNSNNQYLADSTIYATPLWDGVQCFWCHSTKAIDIPSINGPILQGTYGTSYHVDGATYFKPLSISVGGTMANGMEYSNDGGEAHCAGGKKCW